MQYNFVQGCWYYLMHSQPFFDVFFFIGFPILGTETLDYCKRIDFTQSRCQIGPLEFSVLRILWLPRARSLTQYCTKSTYKAKQLIRHHPSQRTISPA